MSSLFSFPNKPILSLSHPRKTWAISTAAVLKSSEQQKLEIKLEEKKYQLLTAIQDTQRGLLTTPEKRASIEDALVSVETSSSTAPIDLDQLDGTWRLIYTSAPDVLVLFESASRLQSLFQVGQIYQKFECSTLSPSKYVRNVIKCSVPSLLEEQEGATLVVSAKFSMVSKRNIYLEFEEIGVQDLIISEGVQAVIAPAILPRSFVSLQLLQFIRSFRYQVPVGASGGGVGGLYYLSYLDSNMLLGRAVGGGGVFVFSRAQQLDLSSN